MNRPLRVVGAFSAGIVGGLLSTFLTRGAAPVHAESYAQEERTVRGLELTDRGEHPYARLTQGDREGSELCFYDTQGHARLKMGLFPDGLPYLGLFSGKDSKNPKALLTLTGTNESSQLVLKDKWNKDRLVMGLDPTGSNEEPFFVYYDKSGAQHTVFGTY